MQVVAKLFGLVEAAKGFLEWMQGHGNKEGVGEKVGERGAEKIKQAKEIFFEIERLAVFEIFDPCARGAGVAKES